MKRLIQAAAVVLLITASAVQAQFPKQTGWVTDNAGLIGSTEKRQIEALAQELKQKTGSELAVVTVKDMGGDAIEPYAARLFETWGIGQSGKDNGVLIILAMAERRFRVEVGYGLESILPDGRAGAIRDEYMLEDFRAGRYGAGFLSGAQAVASVIADDAGVTLASMGKRSVPVRRPASRRSRRSRSGSPLGIILIIFLLIVTRGRILPWLLLSGMMGGGGRSSYNSGGFSGGGFGGGFGGFGGGMSGGGGASGSF